MSYRVGWLSALALNLVVAHQAAADALSSSPPAKRTNVEVELPISEAPIEQWIVVVNRGNLQILPASSHQNQTGVMVWAPFDQLTPDTLRAAVVKTKEGGTITSPLRPGE